MNQFIDFENKSCMITGAGSASGIGFAAAKLLGSLGGKVALISTTDRIYKRAEELKAQGIMAKGYVCDLMNRDQVEAVVRQIVDDFGQIDVLVNNAGLAQVGEEEEFVALAEMTYDSWDFSIARNLTICFNVTRNVIPYMRERRYGRIVNVSSVTGAIVSNPGEAGYSAAKAAIIGMSKALAIEVAKDNIMVNNVLPGWVNTESQTESEAAGAENTPIGRGGHGEEIANMIVFLASDKASYITGQEFIVDGGNTIQEYKGPKELYY